MSRPEKFDIIASPIFVMAAEAAIYVAVIAPHIEL
jgi:hypothetical protein